MHLYLIIRGVYIAKHGEILGICTEAYSNVRVYTDISLICNDATWGFPTTEVKGATIQADV